MKTEVTCSACGIVLAYATEPDSMGLVVRSPDCQSRLHIVPRGRTVLHCVECGAVRVWYPPRPSRKGRTQKQRSPRLHQGGLTGDKNGMDMPRGCGGSDGTRYEEGGTYAPIGEGG